MPFWINIVECHDIHAQVLKIAGVLLEFESMFAAVG
jgi:hypothetical protein